MLVEVEQARPADILLGVVMEVVVVGICDGEWRDVNNGIATGWRGDGAVSNGRIY